jgi:hypothetical protein
VLGSPHNAASARPPRFAPRLRRGRAAWPARALTQARRVSAAYG